MSGLDPKADITGHHSSSGSNAYPWLSTTLPFCMIGTQMQQRLSALIS
jgi:hypothetical protein